MKTLAIALALLVGCAGQWAKVKTIQDEFDGYTIHRMQNNTLAGGGLMDAETKVNLSPQKFIGSEGSISYSLIVDYYAESWLFIESGESLVLLVDGERMGFSGDGSSGFREVLYGASINEKAWYDITRDELERISTAKEVKVKVTGQNYFVERHFATRNLTNIQNFLAEY